MHEFTRPIDRQKLAFQSERLRIVDHTRSSPTPANPYVARPLRRAEGHKALALPPIDDLFRGERLEDALRRGCHLNRGENLTRGQVGDRTRSPVPNAAVHI